MNILNTIKITIFLILLTIMHSNFANEAADVKISSDYCWRCHAMETLAYRDTDTGEIVNLYVNPQQYRRSNHKQLECVACHTGDYSYPHPESVKSETLYCLDCHKDDPKFVSYRFAEIEVAFKSSIHAQRHPEQFNCFSCHDAHLFKISREENDISKIINYDNNICLSCHASPLYKPLKTNTFFDLVIKHQWLPKPQLHWRSIRCVECHTPVGRHFSHQILEAEQSVKNCVLCHSRDAALLTSLYKYRSQEDLQKTGWFNKAAFNNAYIIGMSRNQTIDRWGGIILILTIAALLAHGLGRFIMEKIRENSK